MSWGSNVKTVYITLTDKPQTLRYLMPIYCQCGRMVLDWIFAAYQDAPACPFCGGSISDAKEMEPHTGFYHKVPQVKELVIDEASGVQSSKLKRQFSQQLCNWEEEGRGNCHAGMCSWQDPLWNVLAERDKWRENKQTNTKYPSHFGVIPQHCGLFYSYDKKSPGIFRMGNMMKGELEKIFRDKGRLAGRDITVYKAVANNQTKHIATQGDPSPFSIPHDAFNEDLLLEYIAAMKSREEPPTQELLTPYLRGEIVSVSRPHIETERVALPGANALAGVAPVPIDPSKPMTGVTPQPTLPASALPVDSGSVEDARAHKIPFGKFKKKNYTLGQIIDEEPDYIAWVAQNMKKDHPETADLCMMLASSTPAESASTPVTSTQESTQEQLETPAESTKTPEPETSTQEPEVVTKSRALPEQDVAPASPPNDVLEACNQILNNDPKFKDNAILQTLLDKHGEGLEAFEKYQIAKWDKDRLAVLYADIKGGK